MFKRFWVLVKSIFTSLKRAVVYDPEVKSLVKSHPRLFSFFQKRFSTKEFSGLTLTLLTLLFVYLLFLLGGITEDIINSNLVVVADLRVANLLLYFRNLTVLKFFFVVTILGRIPMVIITAILFSVFLWLQKRKIYIWVLWLVLAGSQFFVFLGKLFIHRSRPIQASYLETTASFPSAHASVAVVLFGFITYAWLRTWAKKRKYSLIFISSLILIILIGFSRLYLGVHFVSDVWAGYLVGLLWLVIGISLIEWKAARTSSARLPKQKTLIKVLLVIFFVSYGGLSWHYLLGFHPSNENNVVSQVIEDPLEIFSVYQINKYTETLTGKNQEPLSFIIVAPSDEVFLADFEKAGWSLADKVNFKSTFYLARKAIVNQEYFNAPMTPSFWNGQVHDFGWEKATAENSVRQRHHARFWKTDFETRDGSSIYVGTASLDVGIKWLVTHKISPDIDSERENIFTDLQQADTQKGFVKEKFVPAVLGKNFSGDQFFTDGDIYVLQLQ